MNKHIIQNIFRQFLIRNGCYDNFKTYIYNDIITNGDESLSIRSGYISCSLSEKEITSEELFKEYIMNVINQDEYINAVTGAFPWRCTVEGSNYWCELDWKWDEIILNYNRYIEYSLNKYGIKKS